MIERYQVDLDAALKEMDPLCQHTGEIVVRRKLQTNGVPQIKKQCSICGDSVGNAIKQGSPEQTALLPPWDDTIALAYQQRISETRAALIQRADKRAGQKWKRQYEAYLDTPEWSQRRHLVMLRAQGICEGCRAAQATEVHHTTYVHAGEEFLFELVAVCGPCHRRYHDTTRPPFSPPLNTERNPNPK